MIKTFSIIFKIERFYRQVAKYKNIYEVSKSLTRYLATIQFSTFFSCEGIN